MNTSMKTGSTQKDVGQISNIFYIFLGEYSTVFNTFLGEYLKKITFFYGKYEDEFKLHNFLACSKSKKYHNFKY